MVKFAKIIGIVFALLGLFLIVVFMPLWCWIVLVGVSFIVLGVIIIKLSS
ncbi:MAG: hypothetical protein IJR47_01110 [Clostridia bacterium]|nr:hypothetical protein [Clostridia bacterium]